MEINESVINELVDVIYERIEQKFAKQLNTSNVEFCKYGIIKEINTSNNTANVEINFSESGFIPNNTGLTLGTSLVVGDKVKVFYDNNNMKNLYIGQKF